MKLLIQRSKKSKVLVDNKIVGEIEKGLVVLVGFTHKDTIDDIKKITKKLVNLRIFDDDNHIMNKSILDVKGQILSISQFTLYADCKKGNRPSYINSMKVNEAKKLYELFNEEIKKYNIHLETGIFQSDMLVEISNDGPVTIILESEEL
ncbi:MAG TPA: D-tyrosyl-tRNA(Tyr) deacylase [Candidatus Faecisoma merdavium]|nr:D-tyrosyl-tRNA(Tyr) deacylase [Candidatus Faecisoma merdavium]